MRNLNHNGKYSIQNPWFLSILFAITGIAVMYNILNTTRTVTSNILDIIPTDICRSIATLTPTLSDQELKDYSITIDKFSQVYNIDWKIPVAIFKQESNFRIHAVNYKTRDFGIGQLHYINIVSYKINLGKLLTDHEYAIHETFKILATLHKKYSKVDYNRGKLWYTRYHSNTIDHRLKYRSLLEEHFKVIKDVTNQSSEAKSRRAKAKSERAVCGVRQERIGN